MTCSNESLKQKTTMKKNSFLWAALSMTAALVMTACSNDDNANESPVQQNAAKTIPYTVTVNGGASTRATVQSDNKTLYFADGDKLYVTGTNIKGVLNIQAGNGSTTGPGTASATFSGDLTYSGSGSPASDLPLTATLVSAQQKVGNSAGFEVSVDDAGAVTVNYPSTAYCADVATAVQKYSNLTGTSTYGAKLFSLTQQTAFLNFDISFADGTGITAGANLSTVVNNNGNTICGGNVTATNDGGVLKAKFVLPVAASTATVTKTLTSAYVKFNSDDSKVLRLRDVASLEGKVYNVKPAQSSTLASVTASHLGWLVGSDGKAYDPTKGYMPIGVTAVAMIAYLGNGSNCTNGLAIQLNASPESMSWLDAYNYSSYPSITGNPGTWRLPSKDDWQNMFVGCAKDGDDSDASDNKLDPIAGFKEKIAATGITGLSILCWSSTGSESYAWGVGVDLYDSNADALFGNYNTSYSFYVLGCLAF
jgi:hypothetical protein